MVNGVRRAAEAESLGGLLDFLVAQLFFGLVQGFKNVSLHVVHQLMA